MNEWINTTRIRRLAYRRSWRSENVAPQAGQVSSLGENRGGRTGDERWTKTLCSSAPSSGQNVVVLSTHVHGISQNRRTAAQVSTGEDVKIDNNWLEWVWSALFIEYSYLSSAHTQSCRSVQWLKCNGTQGNAIPPPPIYGSKRSPTSDCYNARERHTTIVRGQKLNIVFPHL